MVYRRLGDVRRRRTVVHVSTGTLTGVLLSPLTTTADFDTINLYIPFTLQGGTVAASATLRYKPAADVDWSTGLPLDRVISTGWGASYMGSVLDCEPGTPYDLEVTISGTGGQEVMTGQATTRAEDIPAASSLVPTHFVRLDGANGNTGTVNSAGGAWATVRWAVDHAPDGAVVQVGTGAADEYFDDIGTSGAAHASDRRGAAGGITLVAPFPALDDAGNRINVGQRTIIEGRLRAAPSTGAWAPVTLTGTLSGDAIAAWKWADAVAGVGDIFGLSYGTTRDDPDMRYLWKCDGDSLQINGGEGFADLIADDDRRAGGGTKLQVTWHYGFVVVSPDVYAILPPDADGNLQDPNDFWWIGGAGDGIAINAPDCRISGFVLRNNQNGVQANSRADDLVVDHCDIRNCHTGVRFSGQATATGYSSDAVIEYNRMEHRGLRLRELDAAHDPVIPWGGVKQFLKLTPRGQLLLPVAHQFTQATGLFAGVRYYLASRRFGRAEGTGCLNTCARRTVFRHNIVDGLFNGFGAEALGGAIAESNFANGESNCYSNRFLHLADDAWEPARHCPTIKFHDNTVTRCITVMSTAGPTAYGPMYMYRNVAWAIGSAGVALDDLGESSLRQGIQDAYFFKYDGTGSALLPRAKFYIINNTYWTSDVRGAYGANAAAGAGLQPQRMYTRNNIFRSARKGAVYVENPRGEWDEDYNHWGCTWDNPPTNSILAPMFQDGVLVADQRYTSLAAYRTGSGQGAHSNLANTDIHDVAFIDAQFVDVASGDLEGGDMALAPGSAFIGLGVNVPNICPTGAVDLGYQP